MPCGVRKEHEMTEAELLKFTEAIQIIKRHIESIEGYIDWSKKQNEIPPEINEHINKLAEAYRQGLRDSVSLYISKEEL
jgi:hypothetical protein